MKRIQKRGNAYEKSIAPEYIEQLNQLYERWISDWTACPVLAIDVDGIDFQHNLVDLASVVHEIKGAVRL
jgi:deoxyadenosine/deoxycytidine kinase